MKIFICSTLISFGILCSCQKQDSTAEQQLAQRKTELDAREQALGERKSALDERQQALDDREQALLQREKWLATQEKAPMNAQTNPNNTPDPAEMEAERERVLQGLVTEVPAPSQAVIEKAEKEREILGTQKLRAAGELQRQKQLSADELQREKQRIMDAAGMSPAPQ